jgi:para-aminobenzoate synthetase component I
VSRGGLGPVAAAARLAGRRGRVLLDSASDADGLGGWSIVAAEPVATLEARGRSLIRRDPSGAIAAAWQGDPIGAAEAFCAEHGADLRDVAGAGAGEAPEPRVAGWLGYDLGRAIERLGPGPARGGEAPELWLGAYGAVARWRGGGAPEIVGPDPAARARLGDHLASGADEPGPPPRLGPLAADEPDGAGHLARVARVLDYIAAGDVYQVNVARRLAAPVLAPGDALAVYRALAAASPAPYGALIEGDGATVVSGSPERFLGRGPGGARIETRPIKGTRPRGADPAADRAAAAELAAATKDGAEHLMIVDLERNDLGRVAVTGSVAVDRLAYVVELPGLHHLVSRVSAALRPDVGLAALLRATFPGGSITGAPKVRAMEIIDELESVRRGPYCGALGWFGAGGALDLAIAIRIAVIAGGALRVHVGGGIVADSDPAAELDETEVKAAGWRRALAALAAGGA